jgi:hypothetical protein
VGVSGKASLCTAPSLLGIDLKDLPPKRTSELEGLLFELPEKAVRAADCPESWIKNIQIVDLWAQEQKYNTHGINFFRMPNGDLVCSLPEKRRISIPCQDELGRTVVNGEKVPMQSAFDRAYKYLTENCDDTRYIWDLEKAKCWGKKPASEAQLTLVSRRLKTFDTTGLNKLHASQILNRIMTKGA